MRNRAAVRVVVVLLILLGLSAALAMPTAAADDWVAPLPEPFTITRGFDPPDQPYGTGHRGVDIAGSPGQEVRAAGAGAVVYAGPLAGRGVISVQHGAGLRTTYEPVSTSVSAGMSVALGQVIGTLDDGHPGCPMAACLHWGLKRGELYLNPLLLLSQGPVRLLPRYGGGQSGDRLGSGSGSTAEPLGVAVLGLLPMAQICRRRPRLRLRHAGGPGDRPP